MNVNGLKSWVFTMPLLGIFLISTSRPALADTRCYSCNETKGHCDALPPGSGTIIDGHDYNAYCSASINNISSYSCIDIPNQKGSCAAQDALCQPTMAGAAAYCSSEYDILTNACLAANPSATKDECQKKVQPQVDALACSYKIQACGKAFSTCDPATHQCKPPPPGTGN